MVPKRSHLLLAGLLLFLAGVQFRMVESFTLSERSSKLLSTQLGAPQNALISVDLADLHGDTLVQAQRGNNFFK